MSGTKKTINSASIFSATSLAASVNSSPFNIRYMDRVCVQVVVTTSDGVGAFAVQGSNDTDAAVAAGTASWTTMTGMNQTISSANAVLLYDIVQTAVPWVRVAYTRTSGSGTASGTISARES